MRLSTHSSKLERWFGNEQVERISKEMKQWYGPPILVGNTPYGSAVWAGKGGDFVGPIRGGGFGNAAEYYKGRVKRVMREYARSQRATANAGFASLSDLISEATTGGKRQDQIFIKGATTNAATIQTMWPLGSFPSAGSAGSAIAGGSVPTSATAGAIPFSNAGGGDTLHLTTLQAQFTSVATLLLYDRIFHASSVLHSTTGNQAVTGVPTRYATTTSGGNFLTLECTSTLGSTAHNATITYTDQAGNVAEAGAAQAVTVSSVANRIPFPNFFYLLNAGDYGCRTVTNIAFSAVNSNNSQLMMGHPLMFIPQPVANAMVVMDGINSAFNLVQIVDGACLSFLALQTATTASTLIGSMVMVSG